MPINDPPPGLVWNDYFGYLPLLRQEPLGEPFQAILHEHLWYLYGRDRTPLWFWDILISD